MNADHHFEIGNSHEICEDYAISAAGDTEALAIVCDGCSKSPDVDFGARALALSAKRTLLIGGSTMNYDLFGKVTIDNLKYLGDTLPLHPHVFDATLLIVWVKDNTFDAKFYGDGVFFHKSKTTLRIIKIDFESPAPAYLSYHLDKLRKAEYEAQTQGSKHMFETSLYIQGELRDSIDVESYADSFGESEVKGLVEPGDIIGVMSDGVNTFKKGDSTEINWIEIVKQFTDFKTTEGVFVQRKIAAVKRKMKKELTTHYDDISMAAIVV